jgi:hypothetical protein
VISPLDPSSAWTAKANKRAQFAYGLNYRIDINNAIIVDVEATPVRTNDEVTANKTTLDRTDIRCGLKPKATGPRRGLRDGQVPAVAKRRQPRSFARPGLLARHPSPAV